MKIEKTGYNYRTRKERTIMALVYDANGSLLDAIHPGEGNHRTALDWATWRANTIREDYPAAVTIAIHCEDDEIAVITLDNNTPPETSDTMNTENNPVEFSELSHAGQCTDIYLHNTAEIYERYTVEAVKFAAGLAAFGWDYVTGALINGAKVRGVKIVDEAITAAVRLVKKYDNITPTAKDIKQVTRNFAAYIVESAKFEV